MSITSRRPLTQQQIFDKADSLSAYLKTKDNEGAFKWMRQLDISNADRARILTAMKDREDGNSSEIPNSSIPKPAKRSATKPKSIKAKPRSLTRIARKSKQKPAKIRPKKTSRKKLVSKCDRLWSALIKKNGICHFAGRLVNGVPHVCAGDLQAMHLISRRFYATRWDLGNGLPGCAGAHVWYTFNPEAWGLFLALHWGLEQYERRLEMARAIAKPDLEAVLAGLETEAGS